MQTEIKKWGNSAVVRIPKPLLQACNLAVESPVEMYIEDGCIVVVPITTQEYTLEQLLAECKPLQMKLSQEDKDWLNDSPVGKETL